jgi:DNA-binding NarL/FixJ family response regulator
VPVPTSGSPRVLLGNLEPMVCMGMNAVLGEDGVDIVGQEARPAALLLMAGRLRPDAVLLDLGRADSRDLGDRVRVASPETTVILWARDEDAMEVFDPGSSNPRRFDTELPEELRGELFACHARPSTPQVEE